MPGDPIARGMSLVHFLEDKRCRGCWFGSVRYLQSISSESRGVGDLKLIPAVTKVEPVEAIRVKIEDSDVKCLAALEVEVRLRRYESTSLVLTCLKKKEPRVVSVKQDPQDCVVYFSVPDLLSRPAKKRRFFLDAVEVPTFASLSQKSLPYVLKEEDIKKIKALKNVETLSIYSSQIQCIDQFRAAA